MRKAKGRDRKVPRKGGRPRKSLAELEVTGGYDRNPGRLLKRLGIQKHEPAENTIETPEYLARLDAFFAEYEAARKIDGSYAEACELDDQGEHEEADHVLAAAGEDAERIRLRRRHLNWVRDNGGANK